MPWPIILRRIVRLLTPLLYLFVQSATQHIPELISRRHVYGQEAICVALVSPCTCLEQATRTVDVATRAGGMQRRRSRVIACKDRSSCSEQQQHAVDLPSLGGLHEGGRAFIGAFLNIYTCLKKRGYECVVASSGGVEQWCSRAFCSSEPVLRLHVSLLVNDKKPTCGMVCAGVISQLLSPLDLTMILHFLK